MNEHRGPGVTLTSRTASRGRSSAELRVKLSVRAALLAMTTSMACAPSTFDNISGAPTAKETEAGPFNPHSSQSPSIDPNLKAPRQISPISVSWVNTLRPKLRWELAEGLTGAVVELSRTRDFKGEVQRFVGTGSELVVPMDLAPGFWFWRLKGRANTVEGATKDDSVVWEFLVRGGGPNGASDSVNGSIVDMNGDGEPDLVISDQEKNPDDEAIPPRNFEWVFLARPDHTFAPWDQNGAQGWGAARLDFALAGGIDVDGDGFSDLVHADLYPSPSDPKTDWGEVQTHYGSPTGFDFERTYSVQGYVPTPMFAQLPVVQTAGDMNGDGYGDFSVSFPDHAFASLGTKMGAGPMLLFPPVFVDVKPTTPNALAGGCDLDGDGFSDVAIASTIPTSPIGYARGTHERLEGLVSVTVGDIAASGKATALTTGDFDGNGVTEIAFSTVVKDSAGASFAAVCVYTPNTGALMADHCWKSTAALDGFGSSLVAGDLDLDGRDDIVVASTTGIVVIGKKKDGPGFEETPVPGKFLPNVTMIHPGRPDLARWAAIGADSKSITIFRGKSEISQVIDISTDRRIVKLGSAIR